MGVAAVLAALLEVGALGLFSASAFSQLGPTAETSLPASVEELLDLPRLPAVSIDPQGRYLLLVHERGLLPLERLRQPAVTVAGLRLNAANGAPQAPIAYFDLSLVDHDTGYTSRIDLPENVTIGYPRWAPDGSRFIFTVAGTTGVELWVANPVSRVARRLTEAPLSAARGAPCSWMPDSRDVLCRVVPEGRKLPTDGAPVQVDSHGEDERLVDYFLRSQLELVNGVSGERQTVGYPALLESVDAAPNGQLFLVTRAVPSNLLPTSADRPQKVVEIWDRAGRVVRILSSGADGLNPSRAVHWRATAPASVAWVEGENDRDRILIQAAPFSKPPIQIYRTQHRFAGLKWLENSSLALVNEFDPAHRVTRAWLVNLEEVEQLPRRVGSRSVDAAYPALGRVLTRTNDSGKPVVRVQDEAIYSVSRSDEQTHLERLHLDSMKSEQVWESGGTGYVKVVDLLTPDANLLLTHHENAKEPANYAVHDLAAESMRSLTDRVHPAPELAGVERIALRYRREDGVALSATLYVPADRVPGAELPLLVWAYPRQYGYGSAPVTPDSLDRFPSFERAFKLFFVTQGYAVLDDVSMPVVGNTDTANDTFLEQIVANAQAAVEAVVDTGYADPERVAIAGHSYGAFMVANLLAHTRLFAAGVAMSGAYNRTLTPFGFQTERRSLWEARETYLAMSPLLYSDQIDAPLLLVHGERDDNPGTPPIQSQHLYEAIRHNGGETELLLLPFERHTYRARESVLRTAGAMLGWLDQHVGRSEYLGRTLVATDSAGGQHAPAHDGGT